MTKLLISKGLKLKQALSIVELKKSTFYYKSLPEDRQLIDRIQSIAEKHYFYGYRKIWAELRKDGIKVNHKKVYRLYRIMNLQKPTPKLRKNTSSITHEALTEPKFPNHVWSMDFTFTRLSDGRPVKIFAVEDLYSKKDLYTLSNFSVTSSCVIEALKKTFSLYGKPVIIRSDNGPEFKSKVLKGFFLKERIHQEFIPKGSPYLNGAVERFIGSLKSECLTPGIFDNLKELSDAIENYKNFYNKKRPHQGIDYKVPDDIFYSNYGYQK